MRKRIREKKNEKKRRQILLKRRNKKEKEREKGKGEMRSSQSVLDHMSPAKVKFYEGNCTSTLCLYTGVD
jgi:hypothetical protein